MSLSLFAALACGAAALLLLLGAFVPRPHRSRVPFVARLDLGAPDMSNAIVGTPKKFVISPKDQFGLAVDLVKFPTALTNIAWVAGNGDIASITVAEDKLSAEVLFSAEGSIVVSVTGADRDGHLLTETLNVTAELPVPVVTSLGLAEA